MVYVYDLVFVICFLAFKQFLKYTQDTDLELFECIRHHAFWFEFSFMLLGIFFAPYHTTEESAVAFAACMLTKAVIDIVLPENYRK